MDSRSAKKSGRGEKKAPLFGSKAISKQRSQSRNPRNRSSHFVFSFLKFCFQFMVAEILLRNAMDQAAFAFLPWVHLSHTQGHNEWCNPVAPNSARDPLLQLCAFECLVFPEAFWPLGLCATTFSSNNCFVHHQCEFQKRGTKIFQTLTREYTESRMEVFVICLSTPKHLQMGF